MEPYQELATSVISQACQDAVNGKSEKIRSDARHWIEKGETFVIFCQASGYDPGRFRRRALKKIDELIKKKKKLNKNYKKGK